MGAAALAGCGRTPAASFHDELLPGDAAPSRFPLGAASGEVNGDGAVLWTRYLGEIGAPLALRVFREAWNPDDSRQVELLEYEHQVVPADGGFLHAPLTGLLPGAEYRYELAEVDGGGQSVAGRFRTAPQRRSRERMVFTASACARNGRAFPALMRAAEVDADLHVLLGDTVYADGSRSLDDYRGKWAENLSTLPYRRLRATRSVLANWDDHEVRNDWSDGTDPELVAWGKAAFFEHTPMRRFEEAPDRLWRSVRWGECAEFFILDGRSERRADTRKGPNAEYLSSAQMAWLKDALLASPAVFKVLVNSVPIGQFPGAFAAWTHDQWVGYAAQREDLLTFLEERISGAFFVSGDFHMGSFGAVSPDGPGRSLVEILTGAVATGAKNPGISYCRPPQFTFATVSHNTAVLELDPLVGEVTVRWLGEDGRMLAVRRFSPTR